MGELRNAYRILVRNHKGNGQLDRPRTSSEGNMKKDIREM
jgi:hypothetical protein